MSKRMRSVTTNLCLAIAATFGAVLATDVCAATDTSITADASAPAAAQPLEQLGEIWVRGVHLARAITDAQDDVVRLYNKLNKDYRYGVTCGYASISRGSMIMSRVCMPNIVVDSMRNSYPVTDYGGGGGGFCYGGGGTDMNGQRYYSGGYCQSSPAPVTFVGPPVEAVMMEHRKDYEANVVKVLNSDPQLLQKYNHLVALRQEMAAAQQQYVLARKVHNAAIKPAKGPRAS